MVEITYATNEIRFLVSSFVYFMLRKTYLNKKPWPCFDKYLLNRKISLEMAENEFQ